MKNYFEKFKDPRWQKKRLEVMQKAKFTCENCKDPKSTLNVHHGYYEKDWEPWDYDSNTLWCLCEDCHTEIQGQLRDLRLQLAKVDTKKLSQIMSYLVKHERAH